MNQTEREKIKRFMDDKVASAAVYDVLLKTYLKTKLSTDVQHLAASRIAIDLLQEAWRELEKLRTLSEAEAKEAGNPGV